ncbi:MAG: hypothetical protein HPY76_05920 [Anaerolineae bacterium]|nr:hypothetical protein [Anaerolineae bacterium]
MDIKEIVDGFVMGIVNKVALPKETASAGDFVAAIRFNLQQELKKSEVSLSAYEITQEMIFKPELELSSDALEVARQVAGIYNTIAELDRKGKKKGKK